MVPLHFSIWIRAISSSRCSSSPSWSSREPGPFCNLQCSASVRSHGLPRYHDRWGTTSLRSPSFLCSVIRNRAGSNDAGCADSARQLLLPRGFSPAHVRHARCPVRKHHRLRSWVFFCSSLEVPMTLPDIRTGSLWGKDFCSHFSLRAWSCWPDTGVVVKIIIAGHEQ